ncbi:MAG: hypothetical protein KIT31_36510, partial [Deltaproteobacteria bacterium]|nr:hypothetical protein [Deltaproteobacteria bacterium]
MASKSGQQEKEPEKAEVIEEALDGLDHTLDRVKALYEQYFLGMQKQPPTFVHADVERKLRDLAQLQIRNTALRYRFATLQQKFGAYNTYWRRTLRQIENGTYLRNLSKIGREAVRSGSEIPEEILAAMPKRMREQVRRDREAALLLRKRRERGEEIDEAELKAIEEGRADRHRAKNAVHTLDESEDVDLSDLLAEMEQPDEVTESRSIPQPPPDARVPAGPRTPPAGHPAQADPRVPGTTRTPPAG